jgi:kanamycin kinase
MLSGVPEHEVVMPAAVRAIAAGGPARPVWVNELGGTTFEINPDGYGRSFVKFAPAGTRLPLAREAGRLRWARRFTPVPEVLGSGGDHSGTWLWTAGLPGRNAVDAHWRANPGPAVAAIGRGLRALHDALPVDGCPFTWSAADRQAQARTDVAAGLIPPDGTRFPDLSNAEALARLAETPEPDRLVVCHGDACAPNTLLDDDGRWTGHVDMARLGVADRWADLAIASWSLGWNFGDGWERAFFDAYQIDPDPARIAFYRLLWDYTL